MANGGGPIPSGLGGWSALPPIAGGGRVVIQTQMKSVTHRLAYWRVGAHVRMVDVVVRTNTKNICV